MMNCLILYAIPIAVDPYTLEVSSLPKPSISSDDIDYSVDGSVTSPDLNFDFPDSPSPSPDFSPPDLSYNSNSIEVPSIESIVLEAFQPYSGDMPEASSVPDVLVVDKPSEPSSIHYSYTTPSYIMYPIDYTIPDLPSLDISSLQIPYFPELPNNSIEWLVEKDFFYILDKMPSLSDISGSFFDNVGYSQDVVNYFRSEFSFIKNKYDAFISYLLDVKQLDFIFKKIDVFLFKEKRAFLQHFTEKQRKLLCALYKLAIYKKRVRMKMDYTSAQFKKVGHQFEAIFRDSKAKYTLWKEYLKTSKAQFEHIYKHNKRIRDIVGNIVDVSRKIRALYTDYMSLYASLFYADVLNVERERLLYERMIAKLKWNSARNKEELANLKPEIIKTMNDIVISRQELLKKKINVLDKRISSQISLLSSRSNILSSELNVYKSRSEFLQAHSETSRKVYDSQAKELYHRLALDFTREYISLIDLAIRYFKEGALTEKRLHSLYSEIKAKLEAYEESVNRYYGQVVNVIQNTYYTEMEAVEKMAEAQIEAEIIESFA